MSISGVRQARRHTLVYDEDCGPCAKFKRAVELLDSRDRLAFASIDEADREGMLDCIPERSRHRSFHLALHGGKVLSGAEAIPSLAALLPAGRQVSRLVTSAPGGIKSLAFVYSLFSRLHDSGSCGGDGLHGAETGRVLTAREHGMGGRR